MERCLRHAHRRREETAKMRPNLQCVKVVPACLHAPDTRWTFVRVQRYLRNRIGYQTIKAVVAVAQCAPLAPEKNWPAVESPLDSKPGSNFASTKRPASVLTRFRIENEIPVKSESARAGLSEPTSAGSGELSNLQLATMAIATAVTAANLYYCQPLLSQIARSLHMTARETADIPMLTQVGYALGLLFFAPLGDMVERRGLATALLLIVSVSLWGPHRLQTRRCCWQPR